MDVHALIAPLEQIEAGMEALYAALAANLVEDDPYASQVFARLSFEERSHLSKIAYLRRLLRQRSVPLNHVDINRRVLDEEIALLEDARLRLGSMSLTEAIDVAMRIEFGAGDCHARLAVAEANPEIAAVLVGLKEQDEAHGKRLAALAVERGGVV